MNYHLDVIDFKNRMWIFFILIPIAFLLFILTYIFYFALKLENISYSFFLIFVLFLIEMKIVTILFSKLRYIPNGKIIFDENGIKTINSSGNVQLNWRQVNEIKFYYRGDRFWITNFLGLKIRIGNLRYSNLHWYGNKNLDERIIDRIDINGIIKYVKIRNESEKATFFRFISLSKEKGCRVEEIETNFTTRFFGKTIEI